MSHTGTEKNLGKTEDKGQHIDVVTGETRRQMHSGISVRGADIIVLLSQ